MRLCIAGRRANFVARTVDALIPTGKPDWEHLKTLCTSQKLRVRIEKG